MGCDLLGIPKHLKKSDLNNFMYATMYPKIRLFMQRESQRPRPVFQLSGVHCNWCDIPVMGNPLFTIMSHPLLHPPSHQQHSDPNHNHSHSNSQPQAQPRSQSALSTTLSSSSVLLSLSPPPLSLDCGAWPCGANLEPSVIRPSGSSIRRYYLLLVVAPQKIAILSKPSPITKAPKLNKPWWKHLQNPKRRR